jgi:hypothetical protein
MHRPVMSQHRNHSIHYDLYASQADGCTYCMHCPMTSQADACSYCMGSVVLILSDTFTPATLPMLSFVHLQHTTVPCHTPLTQAYYRKNSHHPLLPNSPLSYPQFLCARVNTIKLLIVIFTFGQPRRSNRVESYHT